MKKLYWIFLFLFPLFLFAQENFYYYKGEKQHLELDTSRVFIPYTIGIMKLVFLRQLTWIGALLRNG